MNTSRIVALTTAAVATAGLTLCLTTRNAPAADPPCADPEAAALAQLDKVAAAYGVSVKKGASTYTHFAKTRLAHAPLDGIENLTEADIAAGAPIMALFVQGDGSGRIPDGAYVVSIQFTPGADTGIATYHDASGNDVADVEAVLRSRDEINSLFPDTYEDPPTPSNIPNITSTHVWHNNRWSVDCTGPGWNWAVFYY